MLVEKLTPELLVCTPQRSPAVPSHDGSLALYNQELHELGGATRREIRVINIETSNSWVVVNDETAYDAAWLEQDSRHCIVYLKSGELGMTWLMFKDVDRLSDAAVVLGPIPGSVRDLKLKRLRDNSIGFAVVGLTNLDGSLHNPELERVPSHSARVFDSCQTKEWNSSTNSRRLSVWYSSIERDGAHWRLAQPLRNVMRNTELDLAVRDDMSDNSSMGSYDISERGIVFTASKLNHQGSLRHSAPASVYYAPLYSYASQHELDIIELQVRSENPGWSSQPKFNKDGTMIGFIYAPTRCPEDRQVYLKHVHEPSPNAISVADVVTGHSNHWQASLFDFVFTPNGHSMYLTARECGRISLFKLDLQPHAVPRVLLSPSHGSCHAVYPLHADDNERILVTTSSFVENSLYQVVLVDAPDVAPVSVSSLSRHGVGMGLSRSQVSELYFEGGEGSRAGDYFCHAHVIRPRDFDAKRRKYPVVILVHDGPIAAWDNAWSSQWNAAVWAEQGYIAVLPNISGSTGFGLDFASSVRDGWGKRPLEDLSNLFQHLGQVPGTDMDNAVIAGAGFGGYLMNWIQGHDFGRKFKAIVSHAGIFDVPSYALTSSGQEHGPFSLHFGSYVAPIHVDDPVLPGTFPSALQLLQTGHESQPQYNPEGLERYNPSRPDLIFPPTFGDERQNQTWSTPMLLLHGEQDRQVPVTQSLAAFRVCQSRRQHDTSTHLQESTGSYNHSSSLQRHNTTASPRGGGSGRSTSRSRPLSMFPFPPRHESEADPVRSTSLDLLRSPQRQHSHHNNNDDRHQQQQQQRRARGTTQPSPRSRLVLFPDEGHTIKKPENLLEWYRQVFAFTNRWTGITARRALREFAGPAVAATTSSSALNTAAIATAAAAAAAATAVTTGIGISAELPPLNPGGPADVPGDIYTAATASPTTSTSASAAAAAGHGAVIARTYPAGVEDLLEMSSLSIRNPDVSEQEEEKDNGATVAAQTSSSEVRRNGSSGGGARGVVFAGIGNIGRRVNAERPVSMMASFTPSSHVFR